MKKLITMLCLIVMMQAQGKQIYQISVYHFNTAEQESQLDTYLSKTLIPALHKLGCANIGVFKPIANDTAADKKLYMLVPYKNWQDLYSVRSHLPKDAAPEYSRMESIILEAFRLAPQMTLPKLSGSKTDFVYELRSYESATEKLYQNKVQMFNEGGEVPLFERLGFNAVFYADVISGSRMPNLMYMTSFNSMKARDEHWKTFSDDAEWKTLSGKPEYQGNVSKADIILMHSTAYSDY
ncbi:NIPSNAP family protein [Flavihumibacter profundi]|uniref:NIPSNAP family protein n=1 Tax=Flavihumibacter profundi TaxID=2716883 RepID=UPI001CC820B7|nr:NIPSNAP family protein [Flavihumibacter profundi]MBZ5859284.1 NIPSNAP family protein [Flavihumibacter profundi]